MYKFGENREIYEFVELGDKGRHWLRGMNASVSMADKVSNFCTLHRVNEGADDKNTTPKRFEIFF